VSAIRGRVLSRKEIHINLFSVLALAGAFSANSICAQELPLAPRADQIATVGGKAIYEQDLTPSIAAQLHQLRIQEYELKSKALEQLIVTRLLEAEAVKQGITVAQLTEREVQTKIGEPTDAEVEAYYLGQKERVQRPFVDVQSGLRQALRQARIQESLQQYLARLKAGSSVVVWLDPPRVELAGHSNRVRGNPEAPVTIVEFSDFHCPFCNRVQPSLTELLARYDGKVRLEFRDFPLDTLHPRARAAAEAANCAGDQGKFWEYHDLLFAQAPKASVEDLKGYARTVGLDAEQFDSCLFQSTHHDAVQRDIDEATKLGMTGTPAFFINGRPLSGAQSLEKFVQIIDDELARTPDSGSLSMRKD
jgi:predicted DsbA family dithiol-disulfide isomerase